MTIKEGIGAQNLELRGLKLMKREQTPKDDARDGAHVNDNDSDSDIVPPTQLTQPSKTHKKAGVKGNKRKH